MAQPLSIIGRFAKVVVPTKAQAFVSILLALGLLVITQAQQLVELFGLDQTTLVASRSEFDGRFSQILGSQIASSAALVTFWATVGLVAYLVCWGSYNLLVQARNEVTLTTQYTNRGHWRGAFETLMLKALGAITLICLVALLKPGLALWLALVVPLVQQGIDVATIAQALVATLGLAVQLYLLLACALLTFTPWYRAEVFTDAVK